MLATTSADIYVRSSKSVSHSTDDARPRDLVLTGAEMSSDANVMSHPKVRTTESIVPCAVALATILHGQPVDINATRYMSITRPIVEIGRSGRSQSVIVSGHTVQFTYVMKSCGMRYDELCYKEGSASERNEVTPDLEVGMISDAELLRRERHLKRAINGTGLVLFVAALGALAGVVPLLALIPGFMSAIGVVGSCSIQLNKIDECRKLSHG